MIARVYFLSERVLSLISNGSAAIIQGVALGLLSNRQLENLTVQRYETALSIAAYSNSSYLNNGLFIWERETVRHYFPSRARVLVAAAGAGRELIALAKAGYEVEGFDCSQPLVESGRRELLNQGLSVRLDYAAPSSVPRLNGKFEAVLIGFSGYMYIPGRERRIRFLSQLADVLNPHGVVMLSFTEGSLSKRRTWVARIGTALRRLRNDNPVEEGDSLKDGFQHHFVREQIQAEMNEAGLKMVNYEGGSCYGHAVGQIN